LDRKIKLAFGSGTFVPLTVGSISIHDIVLSSEGNRWARRIKKVVEHPLTFSWKPRRESR
jgi:hypothetical protein